MHTSYSVDFADFLETNVVYRWRGWLNRVLFLAGYL